MGCKTRSPAYSNKKCKLYTWHLGAIYGKWAVKCGHPHIRTKSVNCTHGHRVNHNKHLTYDSSHSLPRPATLTSLARSEAPHMHIVREKRLAHTLRLRRRTSPAATYTPTATALTTTSTMTAQVRRSKVLRGRSAASPPPAQPDAHDRLPVHHLRRVDNTVALGSVPRVPVNVASWRHAHVRLCPLVEWEGGWER